MPRPILFCVLVLTFGPFTAGLLSAAEPATLELKVTTYNLRFASPQPPNAWPERRPFMQAVITREAPDVFGTQEAASPTPGSSPQNATTKT